ncbi:SDR family NAD(P)-dependent oxidoreductase [Paenibacillus sp. GCM10012306]|uniref:SDR family NAD(P)-dependent oxidoreductase n=1 Tax=Paenibacillus sp. GCM10012306 TaxID=3317342 RepID=UPI00361BFD6D
MTNTYSEKQNTVAITGAGSGLGRDMALGFAKKGYQVFGTALLQAEVLDLEQASEGKVSLSVCDITDKEGVAAWVHQVSDIVGNRGLDILISNAGILTPGPLEVLSIEAIRREFEVNVFGGLSVINEFLPLLRNARGRIVQIGAMTGRFPLPFNGPSSASKATLEAFADVYRTELKPFGVEFIMIQAGNMVTGGPEKTARALKKVAESMTEEQRELYGKSFEDFTHALNTMQGNGLASLKAAERIIQVSEQTPAPIRVELGEDAAEILRLVREKSDEELDSLRIKISGLNY